jgi:hypothetical protein
MAQSVVYWPNVAVVLDLWQAPPDPARHDRPVALKAEAPIEERVRQRAAFRALKRLANIESLGLASVVPRALERGVVVIEPENLQALAHIIDRPLGVVLQVPPSRSRSSRAKLVRP